MRAFGRSTFGLAAIVSLAMTLGTIGIGAVAYEVTHEALEEQLDHRTATETRALLAEPGADRIAAIATAIHRRERTSGEHDLDYALIDRHGRRLAGSLAGQVPSQSGFAEFLPYHDGSVGQSLTTQLPGGARLVVSANRAALDETDRHLLLLFTAAFGAMLLIGLGGAWTLGAVTRARLRGMDRAAIAIIGGDLGRRMPVDGSGSEFDRLARTLNRMLDRIAALMVNLRQVSSDVAHDLRTPLTRLRNRLDEAADMANHDRGPAIDAAIAQANELLEIFAALLRISEIEGLGVRRQFREVALSTALTELVETYLPDAEATGHVLDSAIQPDITVIGDRRLLTQLTANLLDNALRHTPAGTQVQVALHRSGSAVVLRVSDDGPGVPDADKDRLFERFSRAETSRSTNGHGLGLALVGAIAAAHHGSARVLAGPGFAVEMRMEQFAQFRSAKP
jgi:signal transduction histidine kinase